MEQAISDLQGFAAQLDAVVKVPLNENQRNALLSYLYNVGSFNVSSKSRAIVDRLNEKDYDGAADAIKNASILRTVRSRCTRAPPVLRSRLVPAPGGG